MVHSTEMPDAFHLAELVPTFNRCSCCVYRRLTVEFDSLSSQLFGMGVELSATFQKQSLTFSLLCCSYILVFPTLLLNL